MLATQSPRANDTGAAAALVQVLLARAAESAREGNHAAAEAILAGVPDERHGPAVLDLLARVYAQQGRLQEAEGLWRRAVQLDPGSAAIRAALDVVQRKQRPARIRGTAVLVAALAIAAAILLAGRWNAMTLRQLRADIREARSSPPAAPAAAGRPLAEVAIDVPGATVVREGDQWVVGFDSGLFSRGTRLKPDAAAALAAVGRQLMQTASGATIAVVGRTDPAPVPAGSRYRDNAELALARAAVAVRTLREATGFPADAFLIRAAREGSLPARPPADPADLRTVEIRIGRSSQ